MKKVGRKGLEKNGTHIMTTIFFPQALRLFDVIKQYTANVPECYIRPSYGTTACRDSLGIPCGLRNN